VKIVAKIQNALSSQDVMSDDSTVEWIRKRWVALNWLEIWKTLLQSPWTSYWKFH